MPDPLYWLSCVVKDSERELQVRNGSDITPPQTAEGSVGGPAAPLILHSIAHRSVRGRSSADQPG